MAYGLTRSSGAERSEPASRELAPASADASTLARHGERGAELQRVPGGRDGGPTGIADSGRIHVWDLPVRLMFLGLVLAVPVAWYTATRDEVMHAIVGMVVGGLVAARLIWAVVGSRFARFSDFVYSPLAVLRHIRDVARFDARRYIGHDPVSGFLTLLTLATLAALVVSGLLMPNRADVELGWLRAVHARATNVLIVLIPFLTLSALISGWLHNDNPIRAMFSGWKRLDTSDVLPAVVRTAELRLHDRMRAIEALAVMTLLSGAALGLGLMFRSADPRLGAGARAPAPQVVQAPAVSAGERQAIISEIQEQRVAALREVAAAKVEAEREIAARAKALAVERATVPPTAAPAPAAAAVAPTVSPQDIERVRDQLRTELMAELQRQQAARPPQAAAPVQAADQPRLRASDEASLRQILSASGYDRTNLPAMISAGGRLFDHLFAAQGKAAPTSAHPAWPQGRQAASAGETWRCSSCHGFDYQGDPGTARLGGGGVPFRSVRRAERMSPEQVVALLGAAPHNYSDDFLPRSAKIELAMFLVKGQYTASRYFGSDGKAKGVAARGKDRYVTACASCHGFDGRLGVKPNAASLGAIAKDSPAEMFHKIRNGHPGAINAAMRPTPLGAQTDLLAYVQTLPR